MKELIGCKYQKKWVNNTSHRGSTSQAFKGNKKRYILKELALILVPHPPTWVVGMFIVFLFDFCQMF